VVGGAQGNEEFPRPVFIPGIETLGGLRLHVTHEIRDPLWGRGLEQPVALGGSEAEIKDGDVVLGGFSEQEIEVELKIRIVEEDELTLITALDDVVDVSGTEVTVRSRHAVSSAIVGPDW